MSEPETKCTRCGALVFGVLADPPDRGESWWRNTVQMRRQDVVVHHRLRINIFRRNRLPKYAMDRVASWTYTDLDLCDDCAADVYLYAQNLPPRTGVGGGRRG